MSAGTDPLTGRTRQLRETCSDYDEAKKALTRLQGQVDQDQHPKSDITVRRAVEQWLEVVELEDTTCERYDDLIRLYIVPTFGHLPAAKLDAELLERYYARLHRCRHLCNGRARGGHVCKPLSTSTTRKIHYILRGALDRAVRWRHLSVNKAAMAEAPAPRRTEPDPPSADEAARLLNDAWNDPEWGLLLWLTMLTGPRRGEVSALRWRHIDFERGLMWVHQANAQTRTGLKEKSTKTNQRRKVALDEHTVELLTVHRERWRERCVELGVPFSLDAFVFSPAPDGATPYLPRAISQRYRRLALRLRLRSTRLHSLRHYSATELVAAGVDIRTVAGRLGHGPGSATTLKVYAAWVDEADRRAATTMATVFPRPRPTPVVRRNSPYEDIAEALREQIRSGKLAPGDELPTVVQLAVANSVAVGTAHRALAALKDEGLVVVTRPADVRQSPGHSAGAEPGSLRDDDETLLATTARHDHCKIADVERADSADVESLGDRNPRGVYRSKWEIAVLSHKFCGARHVWGTQVHQGESLGGNVLKQARLSGDSTAFAAHHVTGLGEDRDREQELTFIAREEVEASLVFVVSGVRGQRCSWSAVFVVSGVRGQRCSWSAVFVVSGVRHGDERPSVDQ